VTHREPSLPTILTLVRVTPGSAQAAAMDETPSAGCSQVRGT
jgi:hypothetical protein